MTHDHSHGRGKSHTSANERAVAIAAFLTGSFMLVEVVGGIYSGSLALLADAGHMLTDFASLALAWLAFRLARRPADWKRTYGFDRFSVLAAFVNGLTLFAIAAWICLEAYERLQDPQSVSGAIMIWIAGAGLAVNILAFWVLSRDQSDNLNVRAAALHVAGDLLGSIAALVAAAVIIWTGWMPIDPILSVLVALIILRSAWIVVRDSGHILLEGVPDGFDPQVAIATLESEIPAVVRIEHLHAWSITQERAMATLEALVQPGSDNGEIRNMIRAILEKNFAIGHVTIEIEEGE